ncbi:MAG: hypothetical protein NTZ10_04720 [Candidatus Saganbacteria bacterium]|nr:hypothetical protein [Candidatus Saganbacteria bacterium]
MGIRINMNEVITNPAALLRLRLRTQNARHAMANVGVWALREEKWSKPAIDDASAHQTRGFYSFVVELGRQRLDGLLLKMKTGETSPGGEVLKTLREEFERTSQLDRLFGPISKASVHDICGMGLTVYPGIETLSLVKAILPDHAKRADEVIALLEQNMSAPSGRPSPVQLFEDNPSWATETPDIRNIRGNMEAAVQEAYDSAKHINTLVDQKYGSGTMNKIKNIVVLGIGANDMYLKDLPMLVNKDPKSKRSLYSVFEPSQLIKLPLHVMAGNTLFIAISRGGGTEETLKSMEFAKKGGHLKYLVAYANKGKVKQFANDNGAVVLDLNPNIGGRYMWAKGKIVLVPMMLSASDEACADYTKAMIEFDDKFWPVGKDTTIRDLAAHLYLYTSAYNIPGFFACSNHPVLEAGLRQVFQLHDEAVGKIGNGMFAFGAGMEMLPFAHAGADGLLGGAVSALSYGAFVFDTSFNPKDTALSIKDLLASEQGHAGLTSDLLKMACVFPNQAKFSFAGAPNFMTTMDGVNFRNLALMTAFYQNLMYPYLIMNGTNPDSNPNVAMVRSTTTGLTTALLQRGDKSPIEVIQTETPNIMK